MIRERIKTETHDAHMQLEAISYSSKIMDGTINLNQYQQLILSNYIANISFENTWDSLPFEVPESLMLNVRSKRQMLQKDLALLGFDAPKVDAYFNFDNYAAFMGALYVFEGSTLGGAVICRKLKENPALAHLDFHFYAAYGERLGMMWKLFLDHLIQIEDENLVNQSIVSAQNTFNVVEKITLQVVV